MRGLQHPNIVQIRGIQREPLRIVMEYVGGGSLYHLLHNTVNSTLLMTIFPPLVALKSASICI